MKLMRQHGVSYFKSTEVEVKIDGPFPMAPAIVPVPSKPKEPAQQSFNLGPETAAAAPPVEMEIPHHENQVLNLLRLSDNDLVDKLFPEGAPINA